MSTLDVSVEDTATDEEQRAVRAVFDDFRVAAWVQANIGRKSLDDSLPWLIMVFGSPIRTFLEAFADEVGREAARDAYPRVRAFVEAVYNVRNSLSERNGYLELLDQAGGTSVVLHPDLPDNAWATLSDIASLPPGQIWYDEVSGGWKSG